MTFKYHLEYFFLIKPFGLSSPQMEILHLWVRLPGSLLSRVYNVIFLFLQKLFSCLVPSLDNKLLECRDPTSSSSFSLILPGRVRWHKCKENCRNPYTSLSYSRMPIEGSDGIPLHTGLLRVFVHSGELPRAKESLHWEGTKREVFGSRRLVHPTCLPRPQLTHLLAQRTQKTGFLILR